MSVHRYETGDGTRYRVRWRDLDGKLRSATVLSKSDANNLDTDIKARKLRAEFLPNPSRETLDQAFDKWMDVNEADLAAATYASYKAHWNAHVRSRLGAHKLSRLVADPELIDKHMTELASNKVGPSSRRKVLMIASGVFSAELRNNKITRNPITGMKKPSAKKARPFHPFPPVLVERIRAEILAADPTVEGMRDACLVTVMAYVGLRPQEAIALTFSDVKERTVDITKAVRKASKGCELGPTKTGEHRHPPLASAAKADVTELHEALSKPPSGTPIFPMASGEPWSVSAYGAWAARAWRPALKELRSSDPELAWLEYARPYDCRGSFVSLQLRGGKPPLDVAHNSGHSSQIMFKHYAGVIKELVGEEALEPDEQIRRARLFMAELPEIVPDITAQSLKPPRETTPEAHNLLYGDRSFLAERINRRRR